MSERCKFGILGKNISYSFSPKYFAEKFEKLGLLDHKYLTFDIPEIEEFPFILYHKEHEFRGINVTIPYKESVMRYMDALNEDAQEIGAVNTIKIMDDNTLVGYNTDYYGFSKSIEPLIKEHHKKALILGTGGASKAIAYALKKMDISYKFVSRNVADNAFLYSLLTKEILKEYTLIVNCSPIGTHPNIDECPNIPYQFLTDQHLLYDLIYNPAETKFLRQGRENGAATKSGIDMLALQAEKSWEIWNS